MDIHPHRGVDELLLGSSQDEIIAALGAPDRNSEDSHEDGELSSIWTYRMLISTSRSRCGYFMSRSLPLKPMGLNPRTRV